LNRNLEYVPVHKVSRSCSPKDSETNPRLNDKDVQQQSTALKKKRERYSQRRKPASSGIREKIAAGEKPISVIKSITSQSQAHPLGNKSFKTP
jgi:hypothetical protein